MKKEKNQAIEKIERIIDKKKENDAVEDSKVAAESEKRAEGKREAAAIKRLEEKERKRKERERKTLVRKRAAEMKKKERERKRADLEREKLRIKAEKEARRDLLKKETAAERARRKAAEKQAKIKARAEKRVRDAEARKEKFFLKAKREEEKRAERRRAQEIKLAKKIEGRKRGIGGWVAAVVSLGSVTLVLATLLTLSLTGVGMFSIKKESSAAQAYYDFVDYVEAIDTNLSKVLVSADDGQRQRLLTEVTTQATLAASDMARLPVADENKFNTLKFVNQMGDYSKHLVNKLIDGDTLSEEDEKHLRRIYEINAALKLDVMRLSEEMGGRYNFNALTADSKNDVLLDALSAMEARAVDYPELIYDGPFSDGLKTKRAKGLDYEELTLSRAEDTFRNYFSSYSLRTVEAKGEKKGSIETYDFEAKTDSSLVYAELSKKGGKLIFFDCYKDCDSENYGLDYCVEAGEKFLESVGVEGMKPVWATENGGVAYINYAYYSDGIVIYSDMIKLTVCKERGVVSSYDAREYYLNHVKRDLEAPVLTKKKAAALVEGRIELENVRLALIPKGNDKEVLTYECTGKAGDSIYYIYINARSGGEEKIFKVVETTEGQLLV